MGLFSSLAKAILTSNGTPRPAAMSAQDGRHPAARVIDIDGDCEKTVFAYVGVPFKGIRKGAEFYVEPLGRDMVIHSKSTGTTADSAEFGDTPLSYNGTVFGFTYSGLGFLIEHYARADLVAADVFSKIEEKHFRKSVELERRPGTWADIYCGMVYDETEWYVKFFIEDEEPVVEIWSMNWDGAFH